MRTTGGIAYDRAGRRGDLPVILLHAGVADRRMWDPLWSALTVERDVVRLDLRGFGESTTLPRGMLSPVNDLLDTLAEIGIDRSHLVGASFGAAVAVEAMLTRPGQVASLLLGPPGGSLIAELTPDLRAFIETENAALDRLAEIRVPTLVLVGSLDLDAIHEAARRVDRGSCWCPPRQLARHRPLAIDGTSRRLPRPTPRLVGLVRDGLGWRRR